MPSRPVFRLQDMREAIDQIMYLMAGRTIEILYEDRIARAAFERFLEILSEASRGVPLEWKTAAAPNIPWRRIADLGNHIRHAYHKIDAEILWNVYEDNLPELRAAVDVMLAEHAGDA